MVDQIAVVTVTIPANATPFTVDFTDPSITEAFSAAIFLFSRETTDGSDQAGADMGVGFVSAERGTGASGDQAISAFAQDGNATAPNTGFSTSATNSISITDTALAGTVVLAAAYSASIAGGVRMNFTTRTITCKVTAILFAGLARAAADGCSSTTVSSTEGVGDTGVGQFSPDLVIFAASDTSLATPPANGIGAFPNIGFAIKATLAQICAHINADDAVEPTDADGYIRSAAAFGNISGGRAIQTGSISAFPATGFTHASSTGTINAHYLALKFSGNVRLAVANFSVAASTGEQAFNSFGFTPDLVFGMGTLLSAVDAAHEDGARAACASYFVTGRHASRAIAWHHREGINIPADANSSAHTRQEDVAVLQYDHLGAVVQRATWLGASGSGGFILSFSTASSTGFLTALGIQFVPSPPKAKLRRPANVRQHSRPALPTRFSAGRAARGAMLRVFRFFERQRQAMMERLHRRRYATEMTPEIGLVLEEQATGRVSGPMVLRGTVSGPGVEFGGDES